MKWTPELLALKQKAEDAHAEYDKSRTAGVLVVRDGDMVALHAATIAGIAASIAYREAEKAYQEALSKAGGLPKV